MFDLGMGMGLTKEESIGVFPTLVTIFKGAQPDWKEWRRDVLKT